jgi:MerR family transcriptional regulator, thiopeptide resistance regulator
METVTEKRYRAKEFAALAGVTVRTLHFYDRRELLQPAARTAHGYRLYGEAELERLEHILALRFVGFSLDQIQKLLRGSQQPLVAALRMQRQILGRQRGRLERAERAIERAERALDAEPNGDRWQVLRNVIEVFRVEDDYRWTERYYSPQARTKLEEMRENTPLDAVRKGERDWAMLVEEVETAASRGEDPFGAGGQALSARWRDLIRQFTRDDAEICEGLTNLWSDRTHWPDDFKRPWSDAADDFIHRALAKSTNRS